MTKRLYRDNKASSKFTVKNWKIWSRIDHKFEIFKYYEYEDDSFK